MVGWGLTAGDTKTYHKQFQYFMFVESSNLYIYRFEHHTCCASWLIVSATAAVITVDVRIIMMFTNNMIHANIQSNRGIRFKFRNCEMTSISQVHQICGFQCVNKLDIGGEKSASVTALSILTARWV